MSVAVANGGQAGGQAGGSAGVFDDPSGDGAGGAGASANAGGAAAGAGAAGGGGAASGGDGNTGGGSGNAGAGAAASGGIAFPANWKDALDPTIRDLPFLKNVPDVPTLAKNYANAQAMIGADKVVIPKNGATPEEWKAFYQKVGVPEKIEDYKFDMANKDAIDEKQLGAFKEAAHGAGLLPHQAKSLADWFDTTTKAQEAEHAKQVATFQEKALNDLKTELGDDYTATIAASKRAFSALDEDAQKYFRQIGMGKNPAFIKMMAKFGEGMKEGALTGGSAGTGGVSQEQALANIEALKKNPNHAYWNPKDPGYEAARKEAAVWYKVGFPQKKA